MLALLLAATLQTAGPAASVPAAEAALARPVVIGASVSRGYNTLTPLAMVLDATFRRADPLPASATEGFFLNPLDVGAEQIEFALDQDPTLVIAVDFLFWFGYGTIDANGGSIDSEDERLELLEVGLDLLDELECPLVVGDFPDMSASVGRMLTRGQMPAKETLGKLSARVRAWAKERGDVVVLPLADLVRRLSSEDAVVFGRYAFPAGSKRRLLQSDELHPTSTGLAALAHVICLSLARAKVVPEQAFQLDLLAELRALHLDASGIQTAPAPAPASRAGGKVR